MQDTSSAPQAVPQTPSVQEPEQEQKNEKTSEESGGGSEAQSA